MSLRRLVVTTAAMAGIALLLALLAPGMPEAVGTLTHAQATVDSRGADELLLSAVGLVAWAVWTWGVLGLTLTAASAVPGAVGSAARRLTRVLLPAGARRGAALALGVGLGVALGVAAPVLVDLPVGAARPVLVVAAAPSAVPDWPVATGEEVPDWPAGQPTSSYVVVRGDCLWDIATRQLTADGAPATDTEIAAAVQAWWSTNADVIGLDPDRILPGQVLRPPHA